MRGTGESVCRPAHKSTHPEKALLSGDGNRRDGPFTVCCNKVGRHGHEQRQQRIDLAGR